jgi:hypothetical protein
MNDLEDHVRTALRARAEDFTASPDAWERTVARAGRPQAAESRRSRVPEGMARHASASFAPLAAAAVVVAIAVAIATLGSFAGRSGGPADGHSGGLPHHATPPPGIDASRPPPRMPPGTVEVKQTYPGQVGWTGFWPGGEGMAGQICAETVLESTGSHATIEGLYGRHCGRAGLPHGQLVSWLGADFVTLNGSDSLGFAARQVASVTAVLPGGGQVRGVVASGSSLPFKVWVVSYGTWHAAHTTLVFRDAAGHEVARVSRGFDMTGIGTNYGGR